MNQNIKDLLNAALITSPHVADLPSAWIGHMPFASWIVRKTKPNIFVELGTHWGHSYFSICNSIKSGKLKTICYAVDTWQGDEHAGLYDENVYKTVVDKNEAFKNFSHLLKSSFDDASTGFSNNSIGLLHIDGLHTYDAVKEDFENWLPKVTNNGIVMFHDISVVKKDFGVWKFWEELKFKYPLHLEFTHCNGLGVICLSSDLCENDWINPNNQESKEITEYFKSLGEKLEKNLANESITNHLKRENYHLYSKIEYFENKIVHINIRGIYAKIKRIFSTQKNWLKTLCTQYI